MYFINCTSTLLKKAQMLKKLTKRVQIKPSQMLTNRVQVQTSPFTNCTCTISTADLLSLLTSGQKFEIENDFLTYKMKYAVSDTNLNVTKKHAMYNEDYQVFLVEDSEASFQMPKCFAHKMRQVSHEILYFKIEKGSLRVEASGEVQLLLCFSGIEHISGKPEVEFRIRNSDITFLHFFDNEDVVLSVVNSYLIFCFLEADATTVARAPTLQ